MDLRDPLAARGGGHRGGDPESRGQKSDERDAFRLAEQLRSGALERHVFKEVGDYKPLRELGRTHAMVVQDAVRVQNRIKALLRSRGVAVSDKSVYSKRGREAYLRKLPEASRGAATTLFAQYDAVEVRLGRWQDVLSGISDASVRLVLMSPPYDNAREYEGTVEPIDFDISPLRVRGRPWRPIGPRPHRLAVFLRVRLGASYCMVVDNRR